MAAGIKKNPQSPLYTSLGVITKGTVIEVNCSDLGLVTPSGGIVWGKYAQVDDAPRESNVAPRGLGAARNPPPPARGWSFAEGSDALGGCAVAGNKPPGE